MVDVLLHILVAAAMMAPLFFISPPLLMVVIWVVVVCLIWVGREMLQARSKYRRWWWIGDWHAWKIVEAVAPCITALTCAVAVVWRLI